ncbi:chemotaxis protein CheA [Natronolimnohabitans innermongolicus]|uniref:Chemotaxis protein CheA n=1 Tax=Natronolimnohabitans innermongolicus JCM 12255 TaxID=1227499 RepID=L9WIZ7_9EURY|nr:chemotaxis protein CheA [Natronolimnohabitans innermongolicus]ELY49201.1 CheA signal transduction histidine kinase [Natronolimnohabitans innermongolicus JCM 12255]
MSDVFDTFVRETEEDLLDLNNALLVLENDTSDASAIDALFRVSHNLKGNFGAMGFPEASNLAHGMEDLLDEIRDGAIDVSSDRMDLLFRAVDQLEVMVDEISETGETETDPSGLVDEIRASIEAMDEPADSPESSDATAAPADAVAVDAELLSTVAETDATEAEAVYRVTADIGDSATKRVDAMFVLDQTDSEFVLHATDPERSAIEAGEFDAEFDLFVSVDGDVPAGVGGEDAGDEGADDSGDPESSERSAVEAAFEESRYLESVTVVDVTDDLAAVAAGETTTGADGTDEGTDTESTDSSNASSSTVLDRGNAEIESIRVDVETVDDLYNQVEEMVTSRIKLRNIIEDIGVPEAEDELNEHDKITSKLQDTVLDMRLVPLRTIAGHFPRLVRDLARDQEKEIDFEMDAVDIEMDRSILNEMRDPLVHLLRNAVDHGIEPPEVREENGKPRTGTIELRGERERDRVRITVEDDGAGLDVERIKSKAIDRGIVSAEEIEYMEESEVYDLIFHPGFSTNEEVTEVSGRGVGMDVVNETVRGVDGSINVESEPGEGTSITLSLPVSVAIVRVLFVSVGEETYGVPIKNIADISALEAVSIQQMESTSVLNHEDRVYPIIDLGEALSAPEAESTDDDLIVRIKDDVRQVALRCNGMTGQEEVVIKPFEGSLSGITGISGAAVLGEGEVVMMLDVQTV